MAPRKSDRWFGVAQTGDISNRRFVARRARRLLPAALAMYTFVLLAVLVLLPPMEIASAGTTVATAATYWSHEFFRSLSSNYFSGTVRTNSLLHTWSLGVEEQFYFLWPWLFLGASRCGRGRATRITTRGIFILLTLVSFSAACWAVAERPQAAFFSTPLRAWEFGIGALASGGALVPRRVDIRTACSAGSPRRRPRSGAVRGDVLRRLD